MFVFCAVTPCELEVSYEVSEEHTVFIFRAEDEGTVFFET
jgi:hypothetical protein